MSDKTTITTKDLKDYCKEVAKAEPIKSAADLKSASKGAK